MKIGIISQNPDFYKNVIREKYQKIVSEILYLEDIEDFIRAKESFVLVIVDNLGLQLLEEERISVFIAYCRSEKIEMIIAEDVEEQFLIREFEEFMNGRMTKVEKTESEVGSKTATEEIFKNGKPIERFVDREVVQESCPLQEKARIGIIGVSDGAGVSFVVLSLAKAICDCGLMPAVLELGKGSFYDAVGIDKRFAGREFFSYHKALKDGERIRNRHNLDEGINWVLRESGENDIRLSTNHMQRLINNVAGDIILCDFSGLRVQGTKEVFAIEILKEMDAVIAVIDPMPSRLIPAYSQLLTIGRELKEVIYVINKNNRGINSNEMMRFLKVKRPVMMPLVPQEELYAAEYSCKIAYGNSAVQKILRNSLREIMKRAIPPEILKFQ